MWKTPKEWNNKNYNISINNNNDNNNLDLAREWKNCRTWKWGDTNYNSCTWQRHQKIGTGTERLGNNRTSGNHPSYSIIDIGWNTEKSPGDLMRLAVTQTTSGKHRPSLVWKNSNRNKKKENLPYCGLCCPAETQNENQRKRIERQVHRSCQRAKKTIENNSNGDTNWERHAWNGSNSLEMGLEELWIGGRIESIQIAAFLRLVRIPRRVLKGLEDLEVGWREETIQTTTLLRTARMLRRVLETWGELLSLRLKWKTIS